MSKRKILLGFVVLLMICLAMILKPIPIQSEAEAEKVEGRVVAITEQGTKDIFIKLEASDKAYYINRGLLRGLNLIQLQQELIGKKVKIIHPKYWTPLDPLNQTRHISKLELDEKEIFSELK